MRIIEDPKDAIGPIHPNFHGARIPGRGLKDGCDHEVVRYRMYDRTDSQKGVCVKCLGDTTIRKI